MRVRWTDSARSQLRGIYDYISRDSPVYARRMVDRLTARSKKIGKMPLLGAVVPEYGLPDVREVLDRVKPRQVEILAVIHGARLLPPSV